MVAELSLMKLRSDECHWTLLMISQHWVQVMAWWRQATSHYLSQCWPRSKSPKASKGNLSVWVRDFLVSFMLINLNEIQKLWLQDFVSKLNSYWYHYCHRCHCWFACYSSGDSSNTINPYLLFEVVHAKCHYAVIHTFHILSFLFIIAIILGSCLRTTEPVAIPH